MPPVGCTGGVRGDPEANHDIGSTVGRQVCLGMAPLGHRVVGKRQQSRPGTAAVRGNLHETKVTCQKGIDVVKGQDRGRRRREIQGCGKDHRLRGYAVGIVSPRRVTIGPGAALRPLLCKGPGASQRPETRSRLAVVKEGKIDPGGGDYLYFVGEAVEFVRCEDHDTVVEGSLG